MYHPAAALRQGSLKQTMLADMANLPQVLLDAREARAGAVAAVPPAESDSEQLEPPPVAPEMVDQSALVAVAIDPRESVPVAIATGAPDDLVPIDENQMQLFGA
jgi:hypothetical protein